MSDSSIASPSFSFSKTALKYTIKWQRELYGQITNDTKYFFHAVNTGFEIISKNPSCAFQ